MASHREAIISHAEREREREKNIYVKIFNYIGYGRRKERKRKKKNRERQKKKGLGQTQKDTRQDGHDYTNKQFSFTGVFVPSFPAHTYNCLPSQVRQRHPRRPSRTPQLLSTPDMGRDSGQGELCSAWQWLNLDMWCWRAMKRWGPGVLCHYHDNQDKTDGSGGNVCTHLSRARNEEGRLCVTG